ncbi:hypothetical protein AMTR_s00156p00025900 [Amborella trichopoda]|uniref:Glucan endo-1,3-beta-D-glucosidase n=2 Tax=Amborella trichopoda TaxID=13333 RepID=W1PKU8_AMBTC|nr:hypothetical protein AMTR_s00156p00025900 [Amborella trichopoda]
MSTHRCTAEDDDDAYAGTGLVGVNYGLVGDNLPEPSAVVELCKSNNIQRIRLFEPNIPVLEALRQSGIAIAVGVKNEDLQNLAVDQAAATTWIANHVTPYINDINFDYVVVGNEVSLADEGINVAPAMRHLYNALQDAGKSAVKVTTSIALDSLSISYPPSAGAFSTSVVAPMEIIASFLISTSSPLMLNAYPYFAYASDSQHISLDYALFRPSAPVVQDGNLSYHNIFDAMVDALYSALEKVGGSALSIVVSESGWPSAGNGNFTTVALAQEYNTNLISHVAAGQGTPKKPGFATRTYLFALFNEDQKSPGVEENFGLFYSNMKPVYPITFP